VTKRIVGILFAETLWARRAAALRHEASQPAPSPLDPRYMPPDPVVDMLAALSTLLRAFADEGDVLWTPRRVAPERVPDVPGLARPALDSGVRPTPEPGDVVWGETTDAAVAVNDRRFALALQRRLGCALPSAAVAQTVEDATEAIRAAAAASPIGSWVAKAAHSSAGRGRVAARGTEPDERHLAAVDHLLHLHDAVVVEPWMPRSADFGATAVATDAGAAEVAFHDLDNTARGDFRGIASPATLDAAESARFAWTVAEVGSALASAGYRGPFGVDAFRWKEARGAAHFHPLCEINARLTFGRVARALAAKILAATGRDAAAPWRFRVGSAKEFEALRVTAGASLFPLLLPGPPDETAAWITFLGALRYFGVSGAGACGWSVMVGASAASPARTAIDSSVPCNCVPPPIDRASTR
jgi:hypothetical protein